MTESIAPLRREDPYFKRPTPLLFAHRGGAREAPESTERAFRYALGNDIGTDVLELDVQLTKDERIVVWHGPQLDNVYIEGIDSRAWRRRLKWQWKIGQFEWETLRRAFVADPPQKTPDELENLTPADDRKLLLLEDFLRLVPGKALNIELKECFREEHLPAFIRILKEAQHEAPIVVASNNNGSLLAKFDEMTERKYWTNLPAFQLLGTAVGTFHNFARRAVQVPYWPLLKPEFVQKVRDNGGGTYVFLTRFLLLGGLDSDQGQLSADALFPILDTGVDGIMTDRPREARRIIDAWTALHP